MGKYAHKWSFSRLPRSLMKLLTAPKEPYLTKCKHFFSKSKDFSNFFEIEGENETFSIISSKLWPFHGILSQQCVNVLRKAVLFFSRLRLSSWNFFEIPNKGIANAFHGIFIQNDELSELCSYHFTPKSEILVRKKGKLSFFIYFFLWKK